MNQSRKSSNDSKRRRKGKNTYKTIIKQLKNGFISTYTSINYMNELNFSIRIIKWLKELKKKVCLHAAYKGLISTIKTHRMKI